FGRARLGARGLEAHLHPVVAESAFLRRARYRIDVDDPEGARADAVAAAVAGVRLDDDGVELRPDDGARRAHLEAAGVDAVLADERLPLVNRYVGIRDEGCELVGGVAGDQPLIAPVERHTDVVDRAAVDGEGAQTPRHQRLAADAATQRRHGDPVGVADAFFGGQ